MAYWLLKSEPTTYAWSDLCRLTQDMWDGVRNYQARNYLRAMTPDDQCLFYHSGKEKAIVGVVRVVSDPYPDPTADEEDNRAWTVVDVVPAFALSEPITLSQVRQEEALADMVLVKQSRLSVQPVTAAHFAYLIAMRTQV